MTLDPDVVRLLEEEVRRARKPRKQVVNEALRRGLTTPVLSFPAAFLANSRPFYHGGTTINGRSAAPWPLAPKGDGDRY